MMNDIVNKQLIKRLTETWPKLKLLP